MYFAVKTCAKYHVERIPVIRKTWAKYTTNIGYFSDVAGMINFKSILYAHKSVLNNIPVSSIDKYLPEAFVVPNTTQGHCEKTYNILREADKILKKHNLNWLVVSDDDTIFR